MYVCALFSADVTQPKGSKKERQRYKVKYIHRETISKMHNISTNKIHQNTGNAWKCMQKHVNACELHVNACKSM